jgi:hypothetical protein
MSPIDMIQAEYERLTHAYTAAAQAEEAARIKAFPSLDRDNIHAWLMACENTKLIDDKRIEVRCALRRAINPKVYS